MFPATMTRSSNGYVRRFLIVTLATLMIFAALAIVPGGTQSALADPPPVEYSLTFANAAEDGPGEVITGLSASNDITVTLGDGTVISGIHGSCSQLFRLYTKVGHDYIPEARNASNPDWGYATSGNPQAPHRLWDFSFYHPSKGTLCGNVPEEAATLTLEKTVVGGLLSESDFPAFVDAIPATWDVPVTLRAGTYTASEVTQTDYTPSVWGGHCGDNGSVTLAAGEHKICTITNTYVPPTVPPELTLIKHVVGGTADASLWQLTAHGDDGDFIRGTGAPPTGSTATTGPYPAVAGETYTLSESATFPGSEDYSASSWTCTIDGEPVVGNGYAITLQNEQSGVCEITNTYVEPTGAIIIKKVTENAPAGDTTSFSFSQSIDGSADFDLGDGGTKKFTNVPGGTHAVTEADPTPGFDLVKIKCDHEGSSVDLDTRTATITGVPDTTVTCIFTNKYALPEPVPGIDIEKFTNGENADAETGPVLAVGDAVEWKYVVENTGEVDLTGVIVTDDVLGDVCTIGDLAIDEIATCYMYGTATLGQYANNGTAEDNQGVEPTVEDTDPSHYLGMAAPIPGIDIEKFTNGQDADEATGPVIAVGDPVEWTYVVTNKGAVDLTDVVVTDDILGEICTFDLIVAGASETCTASGVAGAGQYKNVADVSGWAFQEVELIDSDPSHYFGMVSSIDIEKTPDSQTIFESEDALFTITVTNTSNVTLFEVTVTDALTPSCDAYLGSMVPGESESYQCTAPHVENDFTNVAVVKGFDELENIVTDLDDADVIVLHPELVSDSGICESDTSEIGITLDKPYLTWDSKNWPTGATLHMRIFDKNMNPYSDTIVSGSGRMPWPGYDDSGFDPATGIGGIIYPPAELRPIYIQMYTNPETAVDLVEYPPATAGCTPNPAIEVVKDVVPTPIEVAKATEVTWTITVTNTGDSLLQNVELTDALVPACDQSIGNLDAGESVTKTCTSTHTPDGLDWSFTNVAMATGIGLWGSTVTDDDDAIVDPIKYAGTAQAGDTVWLDKDKDGVQDADEPGINGAKVVLKDADGSVLATATTAKGAWDGFYKFLELDAGKYTIEIDMSSVDSSYELTTAGAFTITLADGDDYLDADFGLYAEEVLPKTGVDSEGLTLFALGLLMLGTLAVLSTRQRRIEER